MIPLGDKHKREQQVTDHKIGREYFKMAADERRKDELHDVKMTEAIMKLHHGHAKNQLELEQMDADHGSANQRKAQEHNAKMIQKFGSGTYQVEETQGYHHGGIAEKKVLGQLDARMAQHPPVPQGFFAGSDEIPMVDGYCGGSMGVKGYESGSSIVVPTSTRVPSVTMNWGFAGGHPLVPGMPTNPEAGPSDTVPAMLTPGEAVIPREAAQHPKYKKQIEKMINHGREIQDKKKYGHGTSFAGYSEGVYSVPGYESGVYSVPTVDQSGNIVYPEDIDITQRQVSPVTRPIPQAQVIPVNPNENYSVDAAGNLVYPQYTVPPKKSTPTSVVSSAINNSAVDQNTRDLNLQKTISQQSGQLYKAQAQDFYSQPGDFRQNVINDVLKWEGSKLVPNDAGAGPSKFGILFSKNIPELSAIGIKHPDQMDQLTQEQAGAILQKKYASKYDYLADSNPALYRAVVHTAVTNPAKAQEMLDKSGGDLNEYNRLRTQHYTDLANSNPEKYGPYLKGWLNRVQQTGGNIEVPPPVQAKDVPPAMGYEGYKGPTVSYPSPPVVRIPGNVKLTDTIPELATTPEGVPQVISKSAVEPLKPIGYTYPPFSEGEVPKPISTTTSVAQQGLINAVGSAKTPVGASKEQEQVSFGEALKNAFYDSKTHEVLGYNAKDIGRFITIALGSRALGYNRTQATRYAFRQMDESAQRRDAMREQQAFQQAQQERTAAMYKDHWASQERQLAARYEASEKAANKRAEEHAALTRTGKVVDLAKHYDTNYSMADGSSLQPETATKIAKAQIHFAEKGTWPEDFNSELLKQLKPKSTGSTEANIPAHDVIVTDPVTRRTQTHSVVRDKDNNHFVALPDGSRLPYVNWVNNARANGLEVRQTASSDSVEQKRALFATNNRPQLERLETELQKGDKTKKLPIDEMIRNASVFAAQHDMPLNSDQFSSAFNNAVYRMHQGKYEPSPQGILNGMYGELLANTHAKDSKYWGSDSNVKDPESIALRGEYLSKIGEKISKESRSQNTFKAYAEKYPNAAKTTQEGYQNFVYENMKFNFERLKPEEKAKWVERAKDSKWVSAGITPWMLYAVNK